MSRTQRSVWNYLSAVLLTATTMVTGLVATPILVAQLGNETFGAARAMQDWMSYPLLIEFGLSGALAAMLAAAHSQQKPGTLRATLYLGVRTFTGVALVIVPLGLLWILLAPAIIPVPAAQQNDLYLACVLLLGATVVNVPLIPFQLLAEAGQRSYFKTLLLVVQTLAMIGMSLLFAYLQWGLWGQALAVLIGGVPLYVIVAWEGVQRYGWPAADPAQSETLHKQLWQLNLPTLVHSVCGKLSLHTDNLFVSALLGPQFVAPFILTQRIAMMAQTQLQNLGNASWAALAELHALGETAALQLRLLELTRLVSYLAMVMLVPTAVYNHAFVVLWVGEERWGGNWLTVLTCILAWGHSLTSLWGWLFAGTGRVACVVPMLLISTVVNVAISLAATWWIGLPGPVLGSAIALFGLQLPILPRLMQSEFGISGTALVWAALRPLPGMLPAALLVVAAGTYFPVQAWWELVLHCGVSAALLTVVGFRFGLDASDRTHWWHRLAGMIGRLRGQT